MPSPYSKVGHPLLLACRQALMITAAAAVLGLVVNALRPQGLDLVRSPAPAAPAGSAAAPAGPQPMELEAVLEQLKSGTAIIIDTRSEYDYAAGHIQTARNLEERNLDVWMPDFFSTTPPDTTLIVYCSGPRCQLAERLAVRLYELSYTNVHVLKAGWKAWQARGYPTASQSGFSAEQLPGLEGDCASDQCGDEQGSPTDPTQSY